MVTVKCKQFALHSLLRKKKFALHSFFHLSISQNKEKWETPVAAGGEAEVEYFFLLTTNCVKNFPSLSTHQVFDFGHVHSDARIRSPLSSGRNVHFTYRKVVILWLVEAEFRVY